MTKGVILGGAALVAAMVGMLLVPLITADVVAARVQQVDEFAAAWDVPPSIVPILQAAGSQRGVSWFVLAGVASTATDFARHAPDGVARGVMPGTATAPEVIPPILGSGPGRGVFLVAPDAGAPPLADPQDVAAAAEWLAAALAAQRPATALAVDDLADPAVQRYWQAVLASAPLAIEAPASIDAASPGTNPIQQFGQAVLEAIAAPVSASNLGAFSAWAAGESTCARFNPLATTQPEPGATPFNTLAGGGHVWNYPSFPLGVAATVRALENGRYGPVLVALRTDAGVGAVASAVIASPWGTAHFGSPTYAGRPCSNDGSSGPGPPAPPTVTGPDAVAATMVARAAWYQQIYDQLVQLQPTSSP